MATQSAPDQMDLMDLPVSDLFHLERSLHANGYRTIAGVDEAGRGPLAGPVVAAAVILPDPFDAELLPGLNDSKQLTEKKRDELFSRIETTCASWAAAAVHPRTIDAINILAASLAAMKIAIGRLGVIPDFVLVDGNQPVRDLEIRQRPVVKGDARCASIAAASIVAKVARDRMMRAYDCAYPGYGFCRNKGYGTAEHTDAIRRAGPCPIHRRSFGPVAACAERR